MGRPQSAERWARLCGTGSADTDLAGLRDEAELAKLPEAERDACRNLWIEVDQRLNETPNPANLSQ